jgi:uncharacterized protein YndB with AHSA1/START domain
VPATDKPARSTQITLPSDRELTMIRAFDAPRELVFDAWTKPALLRRWFGPPGWEFMVCEIDLRVGGAWRFVGRGTNGHEMTLGGVYRTIARPDLLIHTQWMEGCSGQGDSEALITNTFVEKDGRTTFASTARYPSREVRDRVLQAGATGGGMDQVFDRLAELLATM